MSNHLSKEVLLTWPKAELHCHLDGSLRVSTLLDEAKKQAKLSILPADSVDGLEQKLIEIDDSESVEAYLNWFQYSIPLLQSEMALSRAAYELAEDNAREQVRYLEVRYAPILHVDDGLSLEQVNLAVLDGLKQAERDFGIRTGLIICGLRDRRQSASLQQAELAVAHRKEGVVGFDLAGGETSNPPKDHLAAFYYARNHLMNITIHAGESWGPSSIHQALFYCGANRIGHGTSLYQDKALYKYVINHQIPLEVCLTSNVQTHIVAGFDEHPVKDYLEKGVCITLNTDNRLFSRTTVTDELFLAHEHLGFTDAQLKQIVLNGFHHAFLDWDEKQDLVHQVQETFATLHSPTN